MVRQDDAASSRDEHVEGALEPGGQHLELVVDTDPQGLENPLGRVPGTLACDSGERGLDDLDEPGSRLDRTVRHDALGEAAGEPPFAVLDEQLGQLANAEAVHDFSSCGAELGVHPHVERTVEPVGEAPLRPVQLRRAHAEIEEDARDGLTRCEGTKDRIQVVEPGLHDTCPVPELAQACRGFGDGVIVGI